MLMEIYQNQRIMVLDTEYETNPKRLICISYLIYSFEDEKWTKEKNTDYIKHPSDVFSVDENGEAFSFHCITNGFLQENGIPLELALEKFYKSTNDIDIIIGQNILSADIQIIRKESIGLNIWFSKIREKLKGIKIFDTMIAFREKNPEERSSLDSIYKFLFNKEMKNHHDASQDCKNTFKCFEKMVEKGYNFSEQKIKFPEESFEEVMKVSKKCTICEIKIPDGNCVYKYIKDKSETEDKIYTIENSFIKHKDELCKKCLGNIEMMIQNKESKFLDLVKIKTYDTCIKDFFEIIGDEEIIVYLVSSFKEKDEIKKLGGRWDGRRKSWYFSYNEKSKDKLEKFSKWIPNNDEG